MTKKSIYLIQNDPEVPPGNITDTFGNYGVSFQTLHPYKDAPLPRPTDIAALIVLGGSMSANDDLRHPFLTPLKDLIRTVALTGIPYLGICLGGQLLAAALGAPVVQQRWEELGMCEVALTHEGGADPLFADAGSPFITFQWHHDSFDLPDGARLLATSAACPNQAFRVGSAAWGLQFHPEVNEAIIRDWCAWDAETAGRTEGLVADFGKQQATYAATAHKLVLNFLQQTDTPQTISRT